MKRRTVPKLNKFQRAPDKALRLFQVAGPQGVRYFSDKPAAKAYRDRVNAGAVSPGPDHWRCRVEG